MVVNHYRNERDPEEDQLASELRRVRETTLVYPMPPEGFEPLRASPEQLRRFGLPLKPDPITQPLQHAFRRQLLAVPEAQRLTFVPQTFLDFAPQPYRVESRGPRLTATSRHERSANWSGGYIKPKRNQRFTSIYAARRVPTPAVPDGAAAGLDYGSSTWVGLDGQRRYLDSSLPQIGTSQFLDAGGGPRYNAWWQWWLRDHHNPVLAIDIPVNPNDLILAQLEAMGPTSIRFTMRNDTSGHITTPILAQAPVAQMPDTRHRPFKPRSLARLPSG